MTRGLQQQSPVAFAAGTGSGGQTISVEENARYQTFEVAERRSPTPTAWLMNSSGALSQATRDDTMRKLFDPNTGIGLGFLRNPMGSSDLARYGYSYDDMPAGQSDPNLANFSISHDLADVVPLAKQAKQFDPALKIMGIPWRAPGWMKDDDSLIQGWLQAQYYPAYAQYFVKYLQAYAAQGLHVDYVTAQKRADLLRGIPVDELERLGAAVLHQDRRPARAARGRPGHVDQDLRHDRHRAVRSRHEPGQPGRLAGLTADAWTIMPFDFGGAGKNMGNLTTQAADGLKNALKNAYGYSDDTA